MSSEKVNTTRIVTAVILNPGLLVGDIAKLTGYDSHRVVASALNRCVNHTHILTRTGTKGDYRYYPRA